MLGPHPVRPIRKLGGAPPLQLLRRRPLHHRLSALPPNDSNLSLRCRRPSRRRRSPLVAAQERIPQPPPAPVLASPLRALPAVAEKHCKVASISGIHKLI